tara:strand:- start:571 stop:894 length:324 start_codon:yes stop_codon:yes gene_type:complete
MAKFRDKKKLKKIAEERIEILFSEAAKVFSKNRERANRYVEMARKLAMKINLRMPVKYKRQYCKHCYSYLKFGDNARKRIRDSKIIIYCKTCKKYTRIPLSKKSREK